MWGTWAELWCRYPYLVERAHVLYRWMADVSQETAESVTRLVHLSLRDGLLEFGATPERHPAGDLLGRLMQRLTSRGSKDSRGAFHTPDQISDFMSALMNDDFPAGETIGEAAAGSDTMWWVIARHMHFEGRDPASFTWVAAEIDPLAVGCLAANALLWRLGGDVIIAHADALAGDSGLGQARLRAAGGRGAPRCGRSEPTKVIIELLNSMSLCIVVVIAGFRIAAG